MAKLKPTLHDRFVKALQARGCTKKAGRATKVTIMQTLDGDGCYYIGKAGALRVGISQSLSIPVSPAMRDRLLREVSK